MKAKSNIKSITFGLFNYKLFFTLLLCIGWLGAKAQTANNAYIFYNATYGYLINNGGNPGVSTSFNKNAIWVANNTMGTNNRNVSSYVDNTKFFNGTAGGAFSLGATNNNWQLRGNNYLNRRNANNGYVRYNGTSFSLNQTNTNQNFTGAAITINSNNTTSNPTISITSAAELSNGGIQLTGNVTGSYVPTYYSATVRSYNNNNTQTYYWTETTDATTTQPSGITDWSDATKTWAITTGGTYASVSSDGLVTITGNPTGNVVITLTVSKGGYTGTQTFTLTRAAAVQSTNTESTISSFSVSPGSAALYVSESQTFTASATVDVSTYTTPAHTRLTNGGNTYYYYNGTLYTNTEDFSTPSTTTATPTFTWNMTGDGSSNASLSATSGASTTLTHSTGVTADKALTLTVEASYTGATSQSKSVQVKLLAPFVAPTITRSGNNISLSTSSLGATIYYTTDGSTPSASNGIAYTAPFSLEGLTLPVTIKAIAVRGEESTTVAEETYSTLSLESPIISISPTGAVTITCATTGASIRYTTDGTDPTSTNGTIYNGSFNVPNLTTVKAIAYKDGYTDSEVASELYVSSGVNGETVILNDYEDHNWSYYQPMTEKYDNYPDRMCSPYPRNVKITYFGYGNNTLSLSETANPAANTFTTNTTASDVKVGIGEDENTFIYYKTLERDANNRFPYELIPNPFYVRPKSGNTYTGFYKWRIKSITDGAVYSASSGGNALAVGAMLDAMTTYYFQPTDNAQTNANNATSMEIELEALWAPAEIYNDGFSKGYNSVERNFMIVSNNTGSTIDAVKVATPCTYTSFYPNGTTNGTTAATLANRNTRRATFTPTAASKIEYMLLNGNNYNIDADAHDLTLGRGIGAAGGTYSVNTFYPVDESKNTALNFTIRIESGVFNRMYLMSNGHTYSNRFQHYIIFGSDYDRAKGDNSKLDVARENQINYATPNLAQVNKDQPTLTCVVKSGEYQKNYWNNNNNAQYSYSFYCHSTTDNTYPGLVSLTVEGGHFASINGGRGSQTAGRITPEELAFTMRFKGGLVENSIYGAASNNPTYGSRRLIFTGGEVRGWIAAGCNGTGTDNNGQVVGDSYVYVGGNIKVGNSEVSRSNNGTIGGNVFGAGRGNASQRASITNSHVAVADNAEVLHDVYGGGFHGYITNTSNVFVLGGTTHGNVYGGGSENGDVSAAVPRQIPTVSVTMDGGLVEGGVYGGSYTTGIVSSLVKMQIDGGQVGTTSKTANIHGGGFGAATRVNGNVELTLGTTTQTTPGVTVYGDVYGGSALGLVNGTTAADTYHTNVTLNKGIINGSLYGGGLGDASTAANVYGPVTVTINGGSVIQTTEEGSGSVFGCNNINGAPQRAVSVTVTNTDTPAEGTDYAVYRVFGGGNAAPYTGSPIVNIEGGYVGDVFGGGLGETAIVTGNGHVTQTGGSSVNIFGGGSQANLTGNVVVDIQGGTVIKDVYGGGALADTNTGSTSNTTQVNLTGGTIKGDAYGGGLGDANNPAYVNGNVTVTLDGTAFVLSTTTDDESNTIPASGRIFGCNNLKGTPKGTVLVKVLRTVPANGATRALGTYEVQAVYGGGNLAPYEPTNPTATGQYAENGHVATEKPVQVVIDGCENVSIEYVYGGGNAAPVPATDVLILGSFEIGNVFGGGNGKDKYTLDGGTTWNPNNGADVGYHDVNGTKTEYGTGKALAQLLGGTIHSAFGGSNTKGDIREDAKVYLEEADENCPLHIDEVYGGGNEAYMAGDAQIELGCITSLEAIYGGAKNADLGGDIVLTITSGHFGRVFGGNNLGGTISGTITVNIEETGCHPITIGELYGCGNQAAYSTPAGEDDPIINVKSFTSIGRIFGGGLGNSAVVTGNPTVNINEVVGINAGVISTYAGTTITLPDNTTVALPTHESGKIGAIGTVFGGGNAAKVDGNTHVNIGTLPTVSYVSGTDHSDMDVVGVDIRGDVFGGGNQADVTGKTNVIIGQ